MDFDSLAGAVRSIPHIGPILAVTLTIAIAIYQEAKNLDERFEAEKELVEEARDIIMDIALYSQNLKASDPRHLKKLAKQMKKLEELAQEIRKHILDTACARERHERKFGPILADLYDCVIDKSNVLTLEKRLGDMKRKLMEEYTWIQIFEGGSSETAPELIIPLDKQGIGKTDDVAALRRVRWVNKQEIYDKPGLLDKLVPVCRREDSEDGETWHIARVSYFGSHQPGKYRPGVGAYFGHRREVIHVTYNDFDVLVAEHGSVRWVPMSGRYSEERLYPSRPVKGCHENEGTELAIVRGQAREHMHIGFLTQKTTQLGKGSPKLDCAYIMAGKKEVLVEVS